MNRRDLLVAAALALLTAGSAWAQSYPAKPVRWVVPWPPGGGADTLTRLLSPKLSESLGQQIIVDNRPGAAGNIATEIAAKAQPDGHTLLWGFSTPLVVNPSLYKNLPFNVDRDFEPITLAVQQTLTGISYDLVPLAPIDDTPTLVVGSPCTSNADCPDGGRCVTSYPGGYCTRDCNSQACPAGSKCYVVDSATDARVCIQSCSASSPGQSNCRSNYVCYDD